VPEFFSLLKTPFSYTSLTTVMKARFLAIPVLLMLLALPGQAASVLQVTFEDAVKSSELVFEGRVVNTRAAMEGNVIRTHVTFEIIGVYKGSYASRTLDLAFLGGTVNGLTMEVSDMQVPDAGEHGVYFVESLTRPQAHPLYGWDQGHFVVRADSSAQDRVFSRSGKPITGFQAAAVKPTGLSTGVAAGLIAGEAGRATAALSLRDFKQRINSILASK
jgi:hypothetical protein